MFCVHVFILDICLIICINLSTICAVRKVLDVMNNNNHHMNKRQTFWGDQTTFLPSNLSIYISMCEGWS